MPDRAPYLGSKNAAVTGRVPYLGPASASTSRTPYLGAAAAQHHGSLLGNLLGDVGSTIAGVVPAGVTIGKAVAHDVGQNVHGHPTGVLQGGGDVENKVVKPALQAEKYQWAPLVHGDAEEWYRRFHEHPLGPVLDVLTVATGGLSRAAALSTAAKGERAAALATGKLPGPLREITARAAEGGKPVPIRTVPRQGARAARMIATDKALKKLPPQTPLVGEHSRAARGARRASLHVSLAGQADPRLVDYLKAYKPLSADQRVAVALLARLPLQHDYEAWLKTLPKTKVGQATAKIASRGGVRKAYLNPPEKVLRAVEAGRGLAHAREEILARTTPVKEATIAEAPYRHMRTVRAITGTRPRTVEEARARLSALEAEHDKALDQIAAAKYGPVDRGEVAYRNLHNARAQRQQSGLTRAGRPSDASGRKLNVMPGVKDERRRLVEQAVEDSITRNPEHPSLQRWRERTNEIDQLRNTLNPMPGEPVAAAELGQTPQLQPGRRGEPLDFSHGPSVDDLRAEIETAGRPLPFYLPDRPATKQGLRSPYLGGEAGGHLTPERALADVHQSTQHLFRTGLLALHPDVLSPAYLRAVRHDYYLDLHEQARRAAAPVAKGAGLPDGYRWLREVRGQKIPATETATGEHLAALNEAFPDTGEYEGFTLKPNEPEERIALDAKGRRLAVSEQFAKDLGGEYRRAGLAVRLFVARPLQVWRALVLQLRVPWLINNVLGNSLLGALRFAGPDGLKAFAGMVGETKGAQAVRKLLGDPVTRNHLTEADIAALYPEQLRGTFIGTQLPKFSGKVGKVTQSTLAAPLRALPRVDRATEQALRRAATETVLRGSPEVKALYDAMPAQARSWRAAMVKASEDPKLRRMVVREVDDALGSFLSLTPFERGALRNVVPFYAWYREITRIALKLPLDAPGRTLIFAKLATIADEQNQQQLGPVPSYLRGAVPLGAPEGDMQRVLALQNANPFQTVQQPGKAAGAVVGAGNPQAGAQSALGMLSPFITTPVDYLSRAAHGQATGGLGPAYEDFLSNLPEARLALNPPSRLYPTRKRRDLIAQFLGSPVRDVSRSQARYYASQGK